MCAIAYIAQAPVLALSHHAASGGVLHPLRNKTAQMVPIQAKYWELALDDCKYFWTAGLLDKAMGYQDRQIEAWTNTVGCSPAYIPMMQSADPHNISIAEMVTRTHPENADGWFWMAELLPTDPPERAVALYQQGLQIDPSAAIPWCSLSLLLSKNDLPAAVEAALQCCYRGDPGKNGCNRAGLYTEQQGDLETAVRYYRLSTWPGALERASELEKQLQSNSK